MKHFKLKLWGSRIYVKELLILTEEEKLKKPQLHKDNNVGDITNEVDCQGYIYKDDKGVFCYEYVKDQETKELYQSIIDNKIIESFRECRKPKFINNNKIICGYLCQRI